ncbi:MAG: prepilin-type N-terminal cleavage/methylation domain-containing protein [Patescibacteria group bacterium]
MKKINVVPSRGFTLIELLVVIAIIGILSGIVLVNLRSSQQKARDARRLSDIRSLVTAANTYYSDNKNFPTALSALVPNQISAVPLDPKSTAAAPVAYLYAALGSGTDCNGYHLGATLENTGSDSFNNDSDAASAGAGICTGSGADFSGVDPVYDIKQ